ncbi:MAG: glycosyltransferase family 4 protein [Acidobacteriota bacterium]|nr:glycosyltransferase family 4 protein [Acidobacteriota bacterium]
MTKILYISADWGTGRDGEPTPGGSCFYRVVQPAEALARNGIETMVVKHFSYDSTTGEILGRPDADADPVGGFDIVVFQRWMRESGAVLTERAQAYGQIVVQDIDDWHWGLDTDHTAFNATHPKASPTANRNHYWRTLARADLITVSTDYLAARLAKLNVPTVVVPNAIDLSRYADQPVRDTERPVVGWVGGVPWRSRDLQILQGVLGPYMVRHGLSFIHGGHVPAAPRAADLLGLRPETPTTERLMVPVSEYPSLFEGIDLFIAPLADTPFNLAKSSIKLLEASASGIPWVASDIGPYRSSQGGRLARRPKDWQRHLEVLIDPSERALQRATQLEWASTYSIDRLWTNWVNAYKTISGVDLAVT